MLPDDQLGDTADLHLAWLDYYRQTVERKLAGLSEAELRQSRVPSGWTPLELLKHLVFMERRWLRWGSAAEPFGRPWADSGGDDEAPWQLEPGDDLGGLLDQLHEGAERAREIVVGAALDSKAAVGGRFGPEDQRPTLNWVLFHVLQEYARHIGQLDVARELADGVTGE